MKQSVLLLLVLVTVVCSAPAQVKVEVFTDQDQFMPDEVVPVAARVINHSGQTLHLGKDADWLTFDVESREGAPVVKTGDVPVVQEFDLASSKMATKHVELGPYFDLSRPGRYVITASVKIKDWGATVTSEPKIIDVVPGVKLWEQEIGLPPTSTNQAGEPEVRKYALEQTPYTEHMKLYLRVTDPAESRVFKMFALGPMVSFSRPDPELDAGSNLHILYQSGSHSFLYMVVNPQGDVVLRQTFDYDSTRPRLKENHLGTIMVVGGIRRFSDNDVPPSDVLPMSALVPDSKAPAAPAN
jgi:hypothetical protein